MEFNGKKILITGGAGFIGNHLTEALVSATFEQKGAYSNITVVDNLSNGVVDNLKSIIDKVSFKQLDVREQRFLDFLADENFDIIYHFANTAYVPPSVKDPYFDFENNLHATIKLLEHLRQNQPDVTLVYASSAAVYGNPAKIPISEIDSTFPISPYGVAKLAAEQYVSVYSQLYDIKAASLRFFSVYGPRQLKQVIYDFMEKLRQNPKELVIIGDGTQTRDFIFVEDAIQATLQVTLHGTLTGEVYNVATGEAYTTLEVANIIAKELGVNPKWIFTGDVRPGDAQKWLADIDRLKHLGYTPHYSLPRGIRSTLQWYAVQHT